MKHLLIDPGILPLNELKGILSPFLKSNKITFITVKRRKAQYRNADLNCQVIFYEDLKELKDKQLNDEFQSKYNFVLTSVLSDQRTLLIAERVSKIFAWNSLFSITSTIEKIIFNSLIFFQENEINFLFFHSTPHNLPNWVMAQTAELIGIPVRMIQTAPLPYRYWIVEGLDDQKPIYPQSFVVNSWDEYLFEKYIALNQADYTKALPDYEKKRLDSRKGKFWSWKKEIIDIFKNPKLLISIITKRRLYRLYGNLSTNSNLLKKYFVFFLHFQPERTSMPEGLNFSNQWFIIRMISQSLPAGWKLIVKEHPSIYTNHFDFRYRNSKMYKDISKLNNVELVSLDFNTFDLIDKSHGIVTLTGTVGVQALIRNKPVLVFGVASYRGLKNVYTIKSIPDLNKIFGLLTNLDGNNRMLSLECLKRVNTFSVNGINRTDEINNINFYKAEIRINGNINLLREYFKSPF